jgi:hypothetical protein
MECVKTILMDIETGCFFDSHYVTECMRRDFSDEYLAIAQKIDSTNNITLRAHQYIGHLIAQFEDKLVERQNGQSYSLNIHCKGGTCALWKRI